MTVAEALTNASLVAGSDHVLTLPERMARPANAWLRRVLRDVADPGALTAGES